MLKRLKTAIMRYYFLLMKANCTLCAYNMWQQLCSERAELVALIPQPSQRLGQGVVQFLNAFERIVEGYDGAVSGVAFHIVYYVVGCHPL